MEETCRIYQSISRFEPESVDAASLWKIKEFNNHMSWNVKKAKSIICADNLCSFGIMIFNIDFKFKYDYCVP